MGGEPLIILDTHVWFWWMDDPGKLGHGARQAIRHASEIGVSAISLWELSVLIERGRIRSPNSSSQWIETALSAPRVQVVPLTPAIAVIAARLGGAVPNDPADRLIVATAIETHSTLVTKDERLQGISAVKAVW